MTEDNNYLFFFFNDTATTEIYTLSLHDALPISSRCSRRWAGRSEPSEPRTSRRRDPLSWRATTSVTSTSSSSVMPRASEDRSEEHTSELQSRQYLVCRLLLEKKKNTSLTLCHLL